MRKILIGALAVLVGVASAQAAITVTVTPVAHPGLMLSGLTAWKVTMSTGTAETIYSINNLLIEDVHQAAMMAGTPWDTDWALQPAALQPAQLANDSYLLLEQDGPTGSDSLPDVGAASETNDASNPSGGAVPWFVMAGYPNFNCTLGCGDIVHYFDEQGSSIGLDLTNRQPTLDVAHIVTHSSCSGTPHISATVLYGAEIAQDIDQDIPEPATMSLLALGACLPLLRRRR